MLEGISLFDKVVLLYNTEGEICSYCNNVLFATKSLNGEILEHSFLVAKI